MSRKLLLLCVVFLGCASLAAQSFRYKKLEVVHYAWNGHAMDFILERELDLGAVETESAPARIQIMKDGKRLAAFELQWGITQFRGQYAHRATFPENLANSRFLLFANISASKPPIMIAFGSTAGGLGPIYMYGLDAGGKPQQLLAQDEIGFSRLTEFGKTADAKLVTPKCVPQGSGDTPAPYDPFVVWRIRDNDVQPDKLLTQKYNEQHYVWAGAACRDDVLVVKTEDGTFRLKKKQEPAQEPAEEVHDLTDKPHR